MTGPLRAIAYVRVSKAKEEGISPELQITAIEDWCARSNAILVDTIEDLDATGRNFARSGIQQAIRRVEAREADLVVVWKWSRFGRNMRDCLINIDRVELAGARLVAATEDFDDSPVGRFGRGQFLLMAEFESARIGEQWKEAKARRIRQGLPQDGKNRYGYVYDPVGKRYTVDPVTGPILAALYARYVGGESFNAIVASLNTQAVPSPGGGLWWAASLTVTLDSGFAAGFVKAHGSLHPGAHPPLITAAVWESYQRKRRQRRSMPARTVAATHAYAGLVRCATCGSTMSRTGSRDGSMLRCNGTVKPVVCPRPAYASVRTVDKYVVAWLGTVADSVNAKAEVLRRQKVSRSVARAEVKRLAREVNRVDAALTRLTRQVAEGLVPPSLYVQTRDDLMGDRVRVARQLEVVEDELVAVSAPGPRLALSLVRQWPLLDDLGRREVLAALVREVWVRPRRGCVGDRVVIHPRWDPPPVRPM